MTVGLKSTPPLLNVVRAEPENRHTVYEPTDSQLWALLAFKPGGLASKIDQFMPERVSLPRLAHSTAGKSFCGEDQGGRAPVW